MAKFEAGKKRPSNAGRKKGSLNKTTANLKEMILQALDESGGVDYLKKQATLNPAPFLSLVGKVLPMTIVGDKENPIGISLTIIPVAAEKK